MIKKIKPLSKRAIDRFGKKDLEISIIKETHNGIFTHLVKCNAWFGWLTENKDFIFVGDTDD